ncbi:MAG TPA: glycosyltransferase, partial [Solirubrobacteraceae bacterium]|nr:glycosyltransferase [Solirubrobacteraceae bacterium]
MLRTAGGAPVSHAPTPARDTIVAVVPVLNEAARVGAALAALDASGDELAEILVVDGGSTDATRAVVTAASARDPRVRFVAAPPVPPGWNGKAWNLQTGLDASGRDAADRALATESPWVAMVDADARVGATLLADAVVRAKRDGLAALSVATRQELADAGSAVLHPALLTTLVY